MKKMHAISRVAAFLVILALIHVGLRELYYAAITPQDSYLRLQREFTAHQGAYDVVLFGDSHALMGVQPKLLGNAANLSQLGEGYIVRYYKFRYNLRKNPGKITTIILPLDLHSFSPAWGERFNLVSSSRYVNFVDYMWHNGVSEKVIGNVIRYYLFPYADCTADIHNMLPERQAELRDRRMQLLTRNLADVGAKEDEIKWLMRTHYGEERAWLAERPVRYFDRIKALCERENIRVIFVRFPVSRQYFDAASQIVPVEDFDRFSLDLVQAWPGAVLLDYRDLYFDRDEFFADLNHLNAEGSTAFTQHLREDLVRLRVLPQSPEFSSP